MRNFATFAADFPDDSVENAAGDVVEPAGRNVLNAICEELTRQGCQIGELWQRDDYGWEASFHRTDTRGWILLQGLDEWLLIVDPRAPWWTLPGWRRRSPCNALKAVGDALRAVAGIRDIRWMTRAEYEGR